MSCAPHVPLPDVPAEAADAEDEGGDVPGRLEDLPVRTGAAAWAENATKAMIWRNCLSFMSTDYWRFYSNTIAGGGEKSSFTDSVVYSSSSSKEPGSEYSAFLLSGGQYLPRKEEPSGL